MGYEITVVGKKTKPKLVEGTDPSDILHEAARDVGYMGSLHVHLIDATGECRGYTDEGWTAARRELPRETEDPDERPKFTYDDPDGELALVVAVPVK